MHLQQVLAVNAYLSLNAS